MTVSAILHWLVSQALFPVGVASYDTDWNRTTRRDIVALTYNPTALVAAIVLLALNVLGHAALGARKLRPCGIVGTCSLAIAASCHPKYDPSTHDNSAAAEDVVGEAAEGMELLPPI
ncbi:hypothetical protein BJX62DRAFT_234816 [Aspergillus germanicus]